MRRESIQPRACVTSNGHYLPRHWVLWLLWLIVPLLFESARATDWSQEYFNAAPVDDDVVMPMPCGGAMAFRKVFVPYQGPLHDFAITLGGSRDERGYTEGAHSTYISGSFQHSAEESFYLLGKYEVNALQFQSMLDDCAKPVPALRLPQVETSWLEAMEFADKYSLWLRQFARDSLPKAGGELGFLRLPTEEEWEFAARGGMSVAPADFREPVFPMPEGIEKYVWFAGPQSANGRPQFIGLREPNPLGLHDMLGNVDEMVLEPFRLNRLNRLHGQMGGYIVRGGHYLTPAEEVRTSNRQEVPYYKGSEPRRRKTTGFRLALVAPVIVSREHLRTIQDAWQRLGSIESTPRESPQLPPKPLEDPVKELGVIAGATSDPDVRKRLEGLRSKLETIQSSLRASIQERDDQRALAAKAALRLGAFLCQKVGNDGLWVAGLREIVDRRIENFDAEDPRTLRYQEDLRDNEAVLGDNLQYYAETVLTSVRIYDEETLLTQKSALANDLRRYQDERYEAVTPFIDEHFKHIGEYRATSQVRRSQWLDGCVSRTRTTEGNP